MNKTVKKIFGFKNGLLLKRSFTLVELIIVIAIVAILSVAAFLVVTKWIGKSRDTRRLSDLGAITRAFQYYDADPENYGKGYPHPNGDIKVIADAGVPVWYWGDMQGGVVNDIETLGKYLKDPTTQQPYEYSVTHEYDEYEVKVVLEGIQTYNYFDSAHAILNGIAKIEGVFDEKILVKTGSIVYIYSTPSLFINEERSQFVEEINITTEPNLSIIEDGLVIDTITGTNYTGVDISNLEQGVDDGGASVQQVADAMFDGDLTKAEALIEGISTYDVEIETSCEDTTITDWTGTTVGTPTRLSQEWTYSTTPGNCTFECIDDKVYNGTNACVNNTCNGTRPSLGNYVENGTPSYEGTWNHNVTGGTCTFECSDGYYFSGATSQCETVEIGYYSNVAKDSITACSNMNIIGGEYTSFATGGNNTCEFGCPDGFENISGTCTKKASIDLVGTGSLLSYYTFDEIGTDEISSYNLSFGGNPEFVDGVKGKAMRFDGSNDYAYNSVKSSYFNTPAGTFSVWIRMYDMPTSGYGYIFGKKSCGGGGWLMYLTYNDGSLDPYYYGSSSPRWYANKTSALTWDPNKWYHLVFSRGPDGMKMYRDGVLIQSNSYTYANADHYVNQNQLWFGRHDTYGGSTCPAGYFKGDMDEAVFWLRQLSDSEVATLAGN